MNGTVSNYIMHAMLGAIFVFFAGLVGEIIGERVMLVAVGVSWGLAWFYSREVSENAVKRSNAPGRPWVDLYVFDKDQWRDMLSGWAGVMAAFLVLLIL